MGAKLDRPSTGRSAIAENQGGLLIPKQSREPTLAEIVEWFESMGYVPDGYLKWRHPETGAAQGARPPPALRPVAGPSAGAEGGPAP